LQPTRDRAKVIGFRWSHAWHLLCEQKHVIYPNTVDPRECNVSSQCFITTSCI